VFERKVEIHQEEAFEGLEAARQYAETAQKSTRRYLAFMQRLESLGIEGRYLDVGAGPGLLTGLVAQKFPQVEITALELSPAMVTVGQEVLKSKGLQDRVTYVTGNAADKDLIQSLGKFDLVFSTYTLHHWAQPRRVIDNLLAVLADDGLLFLHDLRRVWWMYWVPVKNGFFQSIRGSYVPTEIEELLQGIPPVRYEIKQEFPFMVSIFIRQPAT
jgi:2-polyprenyl-3-methyl-5-hydroxy-6-metoxy-1,4-benzoquinol methylase